MHEDLGQLLYHTDHTKINHKTVNTKRTFPNNGKVLHLDKYSETGKNRTLTLIETE